MRIPGQSARCYSRYRTFHISRLLIHAAATWVGRKSSLNVIRAVSNATSDVISRTCSHVWSTACTDRVIHFRNVRSFGSNHKWRGLGGYVLLLRGLGQHLRCYWLLACWSSLWWRLKQIFCCIKLHSAFLDRRSDLIDAIGKRIVAEGFTIVFVVHVNPRAWSMIFILISGNPFGCLIRSVFKASLILLLFLGSGDYIV